jgi:hypothetical protein
VGWLTGWAISFEEFSDRQSALVNSASRDCEFLARTTTVSSVALCSSGFGWARGLATLCAEAACRPLPRPKEAFEKCGEIKVRVKEGKVNTETGWGDFNRREFGAGCRFKSLGNVRQKGEVDAR